MIKILKFGGTSVGTPKAINDVIQIVLNTLKDKSYSVVVVSAFSGVTNQLIEMAQMASVLNNQYKLIFKNLLGRHIGAVNFLIKSNSRKKVLKNIKVTFKELKDVLDEVFLNKDLSLKNLDYIMSFGERLSAYIISEALKGKHIKAEFLDSRELIKTDNFFGNASVLRRETSKNIKIYFKDHKSIQIVTGFISSTLGGETTTLSRGGSDYTASILGAALGARVIEIWTDVSGIMTADPRKVKNAFTIDKMTYGEAFEISYFGAKVIYPPTIGPAYEKNIPILIKNTFEPKHPGTLIGFKSSLLNFLIKGITSIDNISVLRLEGVGLVGIPGTAGRLFNCLSKGRINVILIAQASSEHSICLAVESKYSKEAENLINQEFLKEINNDTVEKVFTENNLSILTVVGEAMRQKPGIAGKLFSVLGSQGINILAIVQGTSELNISLVINKKDLNKALNFVHNVFFEKYKRLNVFLLGAGKIARNLISKFEEQKNFLLQNKSLKIKLIGLANTKKMVFNEEGINPKNWRREINNSKEKTNLEGFLSKMEYFNLPSSVFVDCTASMDVAQKYERVLSKKIPIVTLNKKANSDKFSYYKKLHQIAQDNNVSFLYETNVGAGLPVISTLNNLFSTGDKIIKIEAVLSGTLSYVFNNFTGDKHFSSLLKSAWEQGLTEPDPRDDLCGMDVARKILILGREIGLALELKDVKVESLISTACKRAKSVDNFFIELKKMDKNFEKLKKSATSKGQVLRYVAILENGKARVGLEKIKIGHPLADLTESDNIISFTTERYKKTPLVVKGPGAGIEVTAAGVFAEIIRLS